MATGRQAVVIGAGIVGLATAAELARRGWSVTVLEKETGLARHQTGRNSGVIHSGLYYKPGSLKATLGVAGAASMRDFAQRHGIDAEIGGKLVVATGESQLPALRELLRRGQANGVPCRVLTPDEAREHEPHVSCVAALRVESTGIVDYAAVSAALAGLVVRHGGEVRLGTTVRAIGDVDGRVTVSTDGGGGDAIVADQLVNCAGLHSDRVARLAGFDPDVRIIPFRGEYFELAPEFAPLVRGLIYPVPDARLPFLGVHLTRMVDGAVHAGPNAVLALAREGYTWGSVSPAELADALRWPGLWRLARRYWRTGVTEVARSLSTSRFARSLRELVPDLPTAALLRTDAGVRAQAVHRDGSLVDDFSLVRTRNQLHVLNAPSPAATASLEIAKRIANELEPA